MKILREQWTSVVVSLCMSVLSPCLAAQSGAVTTSADNGSWDSHMERGESAKNAGHLGEAESEFSAAMAEIHEFGTEDERRIRNENNLAEVYSLEQKFDQAETLFNQAIKSAKHTSHKELAVSLCGLARMRLDQNRIPEAMSLNNQSADIRERILGKADFSLVSNYQLQAAIEVKRGNYESAEKLANKAIQVAQQSKGIDNADGCLCLSTLAKALWGQQRFAEAEADLKQALEMAGQHFAQDSPTMRDLILSLGQVQDMQGKKSDAAEQFKKAEIAIVSSSDTVIPVRFVVGAPYCHDRYEGGQYFETIDLPEITVSASLGTDLQTPSGTLFRTLIRIVNKQTTALDVVSQRFTLSSPQSKLSSFDQVETGQLAYSYEKKMYKQAAGVESRARRARIPIPTSTFGSSYGTVSTYVPGAGYSYGNVNLTSSGTSTTYVPDMAARARGMEQAQDIRSKADAIAQDVSDTGLKSTTLPSGGELEGYLFFRQEGAWKRLLLNVPLQRYRLEFSFLRESR